MKKQPHEKGFDELTDDEMDKLLELGKQYISFMEGGNKLSSDRYSNELLGSLPRDQHYAFRSLIVILVIEKWTDALQRGGGESLHPYLELLPDDEEMRTTAAEEMKMLRVLYTIMHRKS